MTETQYKTKAVALLKRELEDAWVYHPSDRWQSGVPDLLILYRGVFAAVELKVKYDNGRCNKASKLQVVVLSRIQKAGGMTWICTDEGEGTGMKEIRAVISAIKMRANGGINEGHA